MIRQISSWASFLIIMGDSCIEANSKEIKFACRDLRKNPERQRPHSSHWFLPPWVCISKRLLYLILHFRRSNKNKSVMLFKCVSSSPPLISKSHKQIWAFSHRWRTVPIHKNILQFGQYLKFQPLNLSLLFLKIQAHRNQGTFKIPKFIWSQKSSKQNLHYITIQVEHFNPDSKLRTWNLEFLLKPDKYRSLSFHPE